MDAADTGAVGGDIAREAPLLAEDIVEEHRIATTRQSAMGGSKAFLVGIEFLGVNRESVIGGHQTLDICLTHTHLEGRQIIFAHVLLRDE